jgi:hypothetical protein
VAEAVQETAVPTVPVGGQLTVTASAWIEVTVIVAVADAVFEFVSVTTTDTVKVPAVLYVVVRLLPVPEAGLPPVAVHANVYGEVPPVADAVKLTAVPTVPVVGPVIETATGSGLIVIVAEADAVFALLSVTVTDTV